MLNEYGISILKKHISHKFWHNELDKIRIIDDNKTALIDALRNPSEDNLRKIFSPNNATWLFREADYFIPILENIVFPEITKSPFLKICSLGCSQWHELFTIWILLKEYLKKHNIHHRLYKPLFWIDLDEKNINFARTWKIPKWRWIDSSALITTTWTVETECSPYIRKYCKYIKNVTWYWEISNEVNTLCDFKCMNIFWKDLISWIKFDVIFFRNVLIHLSPEHQKKALIYIWNHIKKWGYLFLDSYKSPGYREGIIKNDDKYKYFSDNFEALEYPWSYYLYKWTKFPVIAFRKK